MKNALLFLLLVTLLLPACSKSDTVAAAKTSLPGIWTLKETLADPGDGSGTWQPMSPSNRLTLIFTTAGIIEGNAFPQARRYQVLSNSTIKFIYADGTFILYNYTLSQSALLLSGGGCIEACGLKFEKANAFHL